MKLSVIVPVYNESKTIGRVLESVLNQNLVKEVVVVDDGSKDTTLLAVKQIKNPKIRVFTHAVNRGKGAAIRTGISKAVGDYLIIQDADLEYDPREYSKLALKASASVAVYGSRIMGQNQHAYLRTYLGNVLITQFCNLLYGTKLSDSYTCYKLIPTKVAKLLDLKSCGFEIEAEITGKLAKAGIDIVEVPISYKPRGYRQGKKIKAKDALKGAITFLRLRFISGWGLQSG